MHQLLPMLLCANCLFAVLLLLLYKTTIETATENITEGPTVENTFSLMVYNTHEMIVPVC